MEKDEIILAISFIKTYPTVESYLAAYDSFLKIGNYKDKYLLERKWKEKKNISDVGLKNGYYL